MIDYLVMLAQAAGSAAQGGTQVTPPNEPVPDGFLNHQIPYDRIWEFISHITWFQAAVGIAFASIYLIYGWRVFKVLVVINFAIIGLLVGRITGAQLGSQLWGGIIGTVILGAVSWPFMKFSVSILGAASGAVLGTALWQAATLPPRLFWGGSAVGLVAGAFLAFTSFKVAVMMFTSLQGSVLLGCSALALLRQYPGMESRLAQVFPGPFMVPLIIIITVALSSYTQYKLFKLNNEWSMPN